MPDVWVLGGTGRTGGDIAAELVEQGAEVVLVGRDEARLQAAAERLGARALVAPDAPAMAAAIRRDRPAVVVSTVGPFHATAMPIVDACLAGGSDYVDLANDVATVCAVIGRDGDAVDAGRTLVTGAGFGVTATESAVARLCEGRPPAQRVVIDMIPSSASTGGVLGEALAATLVDGIPGAPGGGRYQGRRIVDGKLVPAPIGGRPVRLTTPDGDEVTTGLMPFGELIAAQMVSGATFVEARSGEAPTGALARALLPLAPAVLGIGPLRRALGRRLARATMTARPRPRNHSWGHARVEWADGTVRETWLALGDASDVTAQMAAEVTLRLLRGAGRPGAFTPARLFGASLAESRGGVFRS